MPTADLGWCLARLTLADTPEGAELTLCSPSSDDEAANSLAIIGLDGILALRDLIDQTLDDAAALAGEGTDT